MPRQFSILIACAALLSLSACSGSSSEYRPETGVSVETRQSGSQFVSAQLAQLETLRRPAGVTAEVWDGLKGSLREMLLARLASGKITLSAPRGNASAAQLSFDSGSGALEWLYFNQGDYDQNGEVNIADLTPLGQHFGESSGGGPFAAGSVQSAIDGDGNGEINIADLTPIGNSFGLRVGSYNVYSSLLQSDIPAANGDPSTIASIGSVNFTDSIGDKSAVRLSFSFTPTGQPDNSFFWVRPADAGDEGTPSNAIQVTGGQQNLAPVADLQASPLSGSIPFVCDLDAEASTDPDGTIVKFEFDLDGDGTFETDTGATGLAFANMNTGGTFTLGVRVTDNLGARDSATVVVESIDDGNLFPQPEFTFDPQVAHPGEPITIDCSASSDPDGSIELFEMDFENDGTFDENNTGGLFLHSFPEGDFALTLRVTDNLGKQETVTHGTLHIAVNLDPVAVLDTATTQIQTGEVASLDPSGSTDSDGTIELFEYDFDDDGVFEYSTAFAQPRSVSFATTGFKRVTLQVTDDGGKQSIDDITFNVKDTAGPRWRIVLVDRDASSVGQPSMAVCNGNPALAYVVGGVGNEELRYIRANDAAGTDWGSPVLVDDLLPSGNTDIEMKEVNGKPLIVYNRNGTALMFARGANADGSFFNPKNSIAGGNFVGAVDMVVTGGGDPQAIAFDTGIDELVIFHATGPDGTVWELSGDTVFPGTDITDGEILNAASFPAVCVSFTGQDARARRGQNNQGSSFSPSISAGERASDISFFKTSGNPSMLFTDRIGDKLQIVRSKDAVLSEFDPTILVASVDAPEDCVLGSLLTVPVAAVIGDSASLIFVQATNPQGTTWGQKEVADDSDNFAGGIDYAELSVGPALCSIGETDGALHFAVFF